MKIRQYQVDAFTSRLFGGNPAAVCPLDQWLEDQTLQAIAAENNLPETAFFVGGKGGYDLRWFTPTVEVPLCGHATLASAFVIFRHLDPSLQAVSFRSKSGELRVTRSGDLLTLDFPSWTPARCEAPEALVSGLGRPPREVWATEDYLAVYDTEDEVRALAPAMDALARLDRFAVIASAPGRGCDFVSRFFAPRQGIPEDPVTGRAHCTLVPFWARRLGKPRLHALQVSRRGGELFCEDRGDRVAIGGRAVQFLEGTIEV
jgi:predicted PhzF superfamily epimerase YddE/YHI9